MNVGNKASYYKLSSKVQNVQVPILHKPSRFVPTSFIKRARWRCGWLFITELGQGHRQSAEALLDYRHQED